MRTGPNQVGALVAGSGLCNISSNKGLQHVDRVKRGSRAGNWAAMGQSPDSYYLSATAGQGAREPGATSRVARQDGRILDPWKWVWRQAESLGPAQPADAAPVSARAALVHLARDARTRKVPVGVIGPREASDEQVETAARLGQALAQMGLAVLCGGKNGVMEAVARGVDEAGGLCVGLLPEGDWRAANNHITLPIATGIGKARNVLIAQASSALIAVGGQHGTLSEIAFGLHFDKPVFGLGAVPDVPGVQCMASVDEVCEALAAHLLGPFTMS